MSRLVLFRRLVAALATLGPLAAHPLAAQEPRFKRPSLPAGADTNDARQYRALGRSLIESKPGRATAAYYWALRLEPNHAESNYAYAMAIRMGHISAIIGDLRMSASAGERRARKLSPEAALVDSLQRRALMLDPFLRRDLDLLVERRFDEELLGPDFRAARQAARERDVRTNAVRKDIGGEAEEALALYAVSLQFTRNPSDIHFARARLFRGLRDGDSAEAALSEAIRTARKADADSLTMQSIFYEPKTLLEYAFGMLCEEEHDSPRAREAYGRALQEDLAFFPAHLRLARLAFEAGDTADAASELALATEAAPDDPYLLVTRGSLLARMGRHEEARASLERLTRAAPDFATGHLLLATLEDVDRRPAEAARSYAAYLAHARRDAPERERVTARLAALQQGGHS